MLEKTRSPPAQDLATESPVATANIAAAAATLQSPSSYPTWRTR